MRLFFKDFFLLTLGAFMDAAGFYFFLAPNDIAAGGINGLALVINTFFPTIPLGGIILGLSILLLITGFILVGSVFGLKTIYCSIIIPVMIWIMEKTVPLHNPLSNDTLLQLIFGVLISGIGLAILFNRNASSGGTDIAARILHKFSHINMGKSLLIIDFFITIAAAFTFGISKGMYAVLGVILYAFVIDYVIDGLKISRHVSIITVQSELVKRYIVEELQRGATLYSARGAYTDQEREIIVTIVNRREFIRLRSYIHEIDPHAFISIQNAHEVLGEGFSPLGG